MENNEAISIIITFIKACKSGTDEISCDGKTIQGARYLLGQVIRQYKIPNDHILVSKKASLLWNELTGNKLDIKDAFYR